MISPRRTIDARPDTLRYGHPPGNEQAAMGLISGMLRGSGREVEPERKGGCHEIVCRSQCLGVAARGLRQLRIRRIWYGALSAKWRDAANLVAKAPASSPPPSMLAITFLAQLFMAWVFAGVLLHFDRAGLARGAKNGMISGLFLWAGFVLAPMIVNHMYQGAKRALTVIDGAHWLAVMLLQGAILGAFALK